MFQVGKESKSKHSSQMCILILFLISQLEDSQFKPRAAEFFEEGIFILTQLHMSVLWLALLCQHSNCFAPKLEYKN